MTVTKKHLMLGGVLAAMVAVSALYLTARSDEAVAESIAPAEGVFTEDIIPEDEGSLSTWVDVTTGPVPEFEAAIAVPLGAKPQADCSAFNAVEMMGCKADQIAYENKRLKIYFDVAMANSEQNTREAIIASQKAWVAYADPACRSVASSWGGSFAGNMFQECQKDMIQQRSHHLWANFMQPMELSSPPYLPEPKPLWS